MTQSLVAMRAGCVEIWSGDEPEHELRGWLHEPQGTVGALVHSGRRPARVIL